MYQDQSWGQSKAVVYSNIITAGERIIMSNIVKNVFSFEMPSDLRRKRVTNLESKFTAFYLKV